MKDTDDKLNLWVNGRMDERERADFERQLDANPELAREAQFLTTLKDSLHTEPDGDTPGELGLARLKRDIERERRHDNVRPGGRRWKIAALAACAVLAAQTVFVTLSQWQGSDIRVASGEVATATPALQVTFKDSATAAQIQTALNAVGGRIVGGPGALGIYRIALASGADAPGASEQLSQYPFVEQAEAL